MNIQEIRQNYPQYQDLSDQELADSLHAKHYQDMPKEQFYSKIGFTVPQKEGILSKIGKGIVRTAEDIDIGASKMGRNIFRSLHLPGGDVTDEQLNQIWGQGNQKPNLMDQIIQGASEFAPGLVLPGVSIGRAGKALESIPKAGGFLSEALSQAIPQGAFGALQNENHLKGLGEGAGGAVLGTAAAKTLSRLLPKNMFRGVLSPEELKRNLEITKGTQTGLGQVVESPFLNRVQENILPYTIGSGAEKTMQHNAKNIQETGTNLVNRLRGDIAPEDFSEKIHEALKNAAQEVEKTKSHKFKLANEHAEKLGITTSRANLRDTAKTILNQVESDPDLAKFMSKKDLDLLNSLSNRNQSQISPVTGQKIEDKIGHSLKNTDILRGKIGEHAFEAAVKGEKPKAAIYSQLKKSLEKDVQEAINKSESNELKDLHQEAMDYYRKEYAPFQDKDILKFTRQGGDPDLILNHFLKGGRNDRSTLLQKLSKAVSQKDNQKNILASSYLSRAMDESGQINPVKLRTLYNKLGTNQRKVLFGTGDLHKEIKDYVDLVGKNNEAFNLMFNPKTGARNTELLAKIAQLGAAGHSGLVSAIPVALGAVGSRALNKALTSPKLREMVVGGMLNTTKKKSSKFPKLAAMIAGLSGQDEQQNPMELELIGNRKNK